MKVVREGRESEANRKGWKRKIKLLLGAAGLAGYPAGLCQWARRGEGRGPRRPCGVVRRYGAAAPAPPEVGQRRYRQAPQTSSMVAISVLSPRRGWISALTRQ